MKSNFFPHGPKPRKVFRQAAKIEMSAAYEQQRQLMRESLNLESTKTLYEMEVEIDYLHRRVFDV